MKNIIIILCSLFLTGCRMGDEESVNKKLTKDFWLNWWGDYTDQHILLSTENDGNGGTFVVERTVFAIGYDDHFIIALQHPDLEEEIQSRLFNSDSITGDFKLTTPSDTIYLSKEDSVYQKNGEWYHINNGWNPPDSLRPYEGITNYFIIDIRKYNRKTWGNNNIYKFNNEDDFNKKRIELNVSKKLTFKIINSSF